jgi:hypothetical protein
MLRPRWIVLCAVVVFLCTGLLPRRAAATDITTPLIISGAVIGAITVVTIVAVLVAGDQEPHFLTTPATEPARNDVPAAPRFRLGAGCRTPDGAPAIACW